MKRSHQEFVELIRQGPPGLLSRNDMARLEAHVQDALSGTLLLQELDARRIVDVGTGGGFPGIPLALELANTRWALVESLRWKCDFLAHVTRALDLDYRVGVHAARAEEAVAVLGREQADCAVSRATAAGSLLLEYLSPYVRVGGHVVAWTTTPLEDVAPDVRALLGLGPLRLVAAPSPLRANGTLAVWEKVAPCTARVPRRAGVARKRPLG